MDDELMAQIIQSLLQPTVEQGSVSRQGLRPGPRATPADAANFIGAVSAVADPLGTAVDRGAQALGASPGAAGFLSLFTPGFKGGRAGRFLGDVFGLGGRRGRRALPRPEADVSGINDLMSSVQRDVDDLLDGARGMNIEQKKKLADKLKEEERRLFNATFDATEEAQVGVELEHKVAKLKVAALRDLIRREQDLLFEVRFGPRQRASPTFESQHLTELWDEVMGSIQRAVEYTDHRDSKAMIRRLTEER
jgi:hypothetical protein